MWVSLQATYMTSYNCILQLTWVQINLHLEHNTGQLMLRPQVPSAPILSKVAAFFKYFVFYKANVFLSEWKPYKALLNRRKQCIFIAWKLLSSHRHRICLKWDGFHSPVDSRCSWAWAALERPRGGRSWSVTQTESSVTTIPTIHEHCSALFPWSDASLPPGWHRSTSRWKSVFGWKHELLLLLLCFLYENRVLEEVV